MMLKSLGRMFFIISVFFASTLYADDGFRFDKNRVPEQLRHSNEELINIHTQLKNHNTSLIGLERMIEDLNRISKIANDCQRELTTGLQKIEYLNKQIEKMDDKSQFEDIYKNFKYDKTIKTGTLVYCQLLSYYSDKYLFEANQQVFLKPKAKIHEISFIDVLKVPHLTDYPIHFKDFYTQFGLDIFSQKEVAYMGFFLIFGSIFGLWVGYKIRKIKIQKFLFLSNVFFDNLIYILPIVIPFSLIDLFVFFKTTELLNPPFVRYFCTSILALSALSYSLWIGVLSYETPQNKDWIKKIVRILVLMIFINTFNIFMLFTFTILLESNPFVDLLFKTFLMFWNIIVMLGWYWFFKIVTDANQYPEKMGKTVRRLQNFLLNGCYLLYFIRFIYIINGNDELAIKLAAKLIIIVISITTLCFFYSILNNFFKALEHNSNKFAICVRKYLRLGGASGEEKEFVYFKILLIIYFVIFEFIVFMNAMDFPSKYLIQFHHFIFEGFGVFNFNVIPIRWLNATLLFVFLIFSAKWVAKYTARAILVKYDSNRRNTVSLIIKYIGYLLAVIISIGILGVSLENLSMIIGFFSLGIGIGMQSIVIDLISGLMILAHKPIRINDYVTLSTETSPITGHVQKILLLSTQIITDDQSVVHVRNANLLKANLENHTLYNQITKCFITFALHEVTDFEKAKSIILDVVKQKSDIVQTGVNAPIVVLDSASAKEYISSVVINLLFYIKNIELKQYVIDDVMKSIRFEFQNQNIKYILDNDKSKN